jgi:protein-L-isoaspartate(D-aspartate) O-methyltransferase
MKASTLSEFECARFNMVEQQIRPIGVFDANVIEALFKVQRELFVPTAYRNLAFADLEIPLQLGTVDTRQVMLSPKLEARLTQFLALKHDDCVLEVGAGSGYQAALLACLARTVTTIEIDPRLVSFAQQNLKKAQINNVTLETGDGNNGWGTAEYDAILLSGGVNKVSNALKYQLKIGGRMVVIVGQAPSMTAFRITRSTAASFETTSLFETVIKPLTGACGSRFKF